MAIHLNDKNADKIAERWTKGSYLNGKASTAFNFDGVKDVLISNTKPVGLVDYTRSGTGRYGEVVEVQDEKQRLSMSQDKSFAASIDKGNKTEQGILKSAGKWLSRQLKLKTIPKSDKHVLNKWSMNAGKIVQATAAAKNTAVEMVFDANTHFIDKGIPFENSYLYIPSDFYKLIRLSPEFMGVEVLAKEILTKGVVGQIADFIAVVVPKAYLPSGCQFLIANKDAVLFPKKIWDTKIHEDPPGISGSLIEGRFIYDGFVIGEMADGVYVCCKTGEQVETPVITDSTGVITCTTSGSTIYYTDDESDPRYSEDRKPYTAALGKLDGKKVRAVAYLANKFPSGVAANFEVEE